MKNQQLVTFLKTVQLFHELPPAQIERLAQASRAVTFSEGQLLVTADEETPALHVLVEGECRAYVVHAELGIELEMQRFYAGDFFGAESVIDDRRSPVMVRAISDGRAVIVAKEQFDELFATAPEFAHALCRTFAARLLRNLEAVHGIPFVHLASFPQASSLVHLIPRRVASFIRSIVLDRNGDSVTVAMVNPSDLGARSFIQHVLRDYHVRFAAISEEDFEENGRKLIGEKLISADATVPLPRMMYQDVDGVLRPLSGSREDDLLSRVLSAAVRQNASDVHLEPYHGKARVRLRVDGRMMALDEDLSAVTFRHLVARIKVLAELDTTRIRRPQDGRFLLQVDDYPMEFRVSASPCHGGEKVVLRVVAPSRQHGDLSRLVLYKPLERLARELFQCPSGLVLVTGPSGAGKTTTLYAALKSVIGADYSKNIVTIEDPVEYDLPFATQIQVAREHGMDFATILRSVLRQDPDVILVGEIRDAESAAMAAEAATTGHLVLSSLHTYSALEAVVRLRDLCVPPYLIAAGLKGVITQQLVPRLAPGYTSEVAPDDPQVRRLIELGVLDETWDTPLQRGRDEADGPPGGELGRVAIFEMLSVTPQLRSVIDNSGPLRDMEKCLDRTCFASFGECAQSLLRDGIVAPASIIDVVPHGTVLIRHDQADAMSSDWSRFELPHRTAAPPT